MTREDIIPRLHDLLKQATTDRSHYYTGGLIVEAIQEITRLRTLLTAPDAPKGERDKADFDARTLGTFSQPDPVTEREAFELAHVATDLNCHWDTIQRRYARDSTERCWFTWQAARAATPASGVVVAEGVVELDGVYPVVVTSDGAEFFFNRETMRPLVPGQPVEVLVRHIAREGTPIGDK